MRPTLMLDAERKLREQTRRFGRSFKAIVNKALRRGLSSSFRVRATECGFRPGIDPTKLNALLDDLELERADVLRLRGR